ncbi:hypothetical protein DM860_006917 [Cuscuta australis]|uniref:N-acetyltransferase domain-containing protein n=1 Tax=Cuscuta australis TaxID=267555 RepID=A0A328E5G1_9ASTE|nr:hypothetical protein DM860_006917 [Cuscuta australis]
MDLASNHYHHILSKMAFTISSSSIFFHTHPLRRRRRRRRKDPTFTPKHPHHFPISTNFTSSANPTLPLLLLTSNSTSSSAAAAAAYTTEELEKLRVLENFEYFQELESGSVRIRVMSEEETEATAGLLAESFAEWVGVPLRYVKLLGFFVKQYLIERRSAMPHTATLVGFYRHGNGEEEEEEEGELKVSGTVEVSFDRRGATNNSPPTPIAPMDCPYICNMAVKKSLRRRGIGLEMLKASEELISRMSDARMVCLHCRMIDAGPFDMYTKAGYAIVKTDSIFILLLLQRRKHLMCKYLQDSERHSEEEQEQEEEEEEEEAVVEQPTL